MAIKKSLAAAFCLFYCLSISFAQETVKDEDAFFIRSLYDSALTNQQDYKDLTKLTALGGRLAGSKTSKAAEDLTFGLIDSLELGTTPIYQDCEAPFWVRGKESEVIAITKEGKKKLHSTSLGNSNGTNGAIVEGEIIEVGSMDDVPKLGREVVEGKIVFFNRKMDPTQINTFYAYGKDGAQRTRGPALASKHGAIGAIVRSSTNKIDTLPHTGITRFDSTTKHIPSIAISTVDANWLSKQLKEEPDTKLQLKNYCSLNGTTTVRNVIGEWKGSTHADEIIVVGGHLDSWDLGTGAHDDGTGCVQSIQALRLLKQSGYVPKRTIRVVMFANEENGAAGGKTYANESNKNGEFHLAAIESDAGGFSPRAFSAESEKELFINYYQLVSKWLPLLETYGVNFQKGGSGLDISFLKSQGGLLFGLRPDSQRYFDYHHTSADTIDAVNPRELALGSAVMSSLIYLIDKYGLK